MTFEISRRAQPEGAAATDRNPDGTHMRPVEIFKTLLRPAAGGLAAMLLAVSAMAIGGASTAQAQRLIATANDSPITDVDVRYRIRLLRALRKPASRSAALESIIEDRIKLQETKKYGIRPNDQQIVAQATRDAAKRKISPQALSARLRAVPESHWKEHWRAQFAWNSLIAALNKAVNVSEREVEAELARRGKKARSTEFLLRRIVLIVPRSAGGGRLQQRYREANNLRARFKGCAAGLQLARALRDVAIQPQISRSSAQMNPQLRKLLESTAVGRLTRPIRGREGIEVIAVCSKRGLGSTSAAGTTIRDELLEKKLEAASKERYERIRRRAIIVRR